MRIGFLVDGQAEYRSLPALLPRIETPHVLLKPLYADIQPFAPVGQVIGVIRGKLPLLASWRVDKVVVLMDRETRDECPTQLATGVSQGLGLVCSRFGINHVSVVIKDRMFENWLVSDVDALGRLPRRFALTDNLRRTITQRADRVDATAILKRASRDASYDKVSDAIRIMSIADPCLIGSNSRSFRRLLRVLAHPAYVGQSRLPDAVA